MNEIQELLEIMEAIRGKCPWDAKQTHDSLKRYMVEEAYEVLDAIDQKDADHLKKELGDLLLQIVFHSKIASEKDEFEFKDVVKTISDKMIERHPHVFLSDKKVSAEEVMDNWEKNKHKNENRTSILSGIPNHLPALLKAQRMQDKAASVGFDWQKAEQVVEKLEEEIAEFKRAVKSKDERRIENEFGDIMFTIVNLSRFSNIIAEEALQKVNEKFRKRFNFIEQKLGNDPQKISETSMEQLDALWEKAKDYD
jgi:tetrapyrrole methylase family protein / MazG family protein